MIPTLIADAERDRPIRVWSVGCASGEEPYSIAMLLAEALGMADFCNRVKIYATDLDEEALKVARARDLCAARGGERAASAAREIFRAHQQSLRVRARAAEMRDLRPA